MFHFVQKLQRGHAQRGHVTAVVFRDRFVHAYLMLFGSSWNVTYCKIMLFIIVFYIEYI